MHHAQAAARQPQRKGWMALAGTNGVHVLDRLQPERRIRAGPRIVRSGQSDPGQQAARANKQG